MNKSLFVLAVFLFCVSSAAPSWALSDEMWADVHAAQSSVYYTAAEANSVSVSSGDNAYVPASGGWQHVLAAVKSVSPSVSAVSAPAVAAAAPSAFIQAVTSMKANNLAFGAQASGAASTLEGTVQAGVLHLATPYGAMRINFDRTDADPSKWITMSRMTNPAGGRDVPQTGRTYAYYDFSSNPYLGNPNPYLADPDPYISSFDQSHLSPTSRVLGIALIDGMPAGTKSLTFDLYDNNHNLRYSVSLNNDQGNAVCWASGKEVYLNLDAALGAAGRPTGEVNTVELVANLSDGSSRRIDYYNIGYNGQGYGVRVNPGIGAPAYTVMNPLSYGYEWYREVPATWESEDIDKEKK